jgi:hypothetical protein
MKIEQLPVVGEQRSRLIEFSYEAFLNAARRAGCVRRVKRKWNADRYLDGFVAGMEMPLDLDYLEHLIEATMIHHVLSLLQD